MKHKPGWRDLSLLAVGLLVVGLDQYTKHLVREHLALNTSWNPIPWLDPIVTLTHIRNTGAAFGLFPNMSIVFVIVATIVIVVIAVYYRQLASASWMLRLALGLQWGGAAGNLIDRLGHDGQVTDFIDFRVWPVFNLADGAVVVGTIFLAAYVLFVERAQDHQEATTNEPQPHGKEIG